MGNLQRRQSVFRKGTEIASRIKFEEGGYFYILSQLNPQNYKVVNMSGGTRRNVYNLGTLDSCMKHSEALMTWTVLPNMMPCGRVILPTLGMLETESSKDVNCSSLQIQKVFRREPEGSLEVWEIFRGGKVSSGKEQK